MSLKYRPDFAHVGTHLSLAEAADFARLRDELGVGNRRLITLGLDALKREIEPGGAASPRKIPPRLAVLGVASAPRQGHGGTDDRPA